MMESTTVGTTVKVTCPHILHYTDTDDMVHEYFHHVTVVYTLIETYDRGPVHIQDMEDTDHPMDVVVDIFLEFHSLRYLVARQLDLPQGTEYILFLMDVEADTTMGTQGGPLLRGQDHIPCMDRLDIGIGAEPEVNIVAIGIRTEVTDSISSKIHRVTKQI